MKKFLVGVLLSVMALTGCQQQPETVGVKEENGFKVLDIKQDEHYSTIVCEATSKNYGVTNPDEGELACQNMYDEEDVVFLTHGQAKNFKVGDKLLVTFFHDDVEKVEKNNLTLK